MRAYKLYVCTAFFLILTVLRMLYPDETILVGKWLKDTLDPGRTTRAFAESLGRQIDGTCLREGLVAVIQLTGEELT